MQRKEAHLKEKLKNLSLSIEEIKAFLEKEEVIKNREYLILLLTKPAMVPSIAASFFPSLFPLELVRVIKTPSTNVFVKQAALLNLSNKYYKLQKGEKKVLWRMVPPEFVRLVKEDDPSILIELLKNSRLREDDLFYLIRKVKLNQNFVSTILTNPKWKTRERILFALASRGVFSDGFIIGVLNRFSKAHLKEFLKNPLISQTVKKKIREYLKIKPKN